MVIIKILMSREMWHINFSLDLGTKSRLKLGTTKTAMAKLK